MFITTFTRARQLSLSWASSIQSLPPHPISWRSILPNLMSPFPCLVRTELSVQFRGKCLCLVANSVVTVRSCQHLAQPPSLRTTPCQVSRLLIQYIRSYRPYWRPFLHPQSRDAPCPVDSDPLITDHQFNIQQIYVYVFCVDLRTNSDYFTVQPWLSGWFL